VPKVRVTRRVHFSAAHRLHNPALTDEENARIYGPCNHPNWHGHNYEMDVTVEGSRTRAPATWWTWASCATWRKR
jgi:6-pyruvoyltetrahydropterin/6-carboxytetrahydropterin synthase